MYLTKGSAGTETLFPASLVTIPCRFLPWRALGHFQCGILLYGALPDARPVARRDRWISFSHRYRRLASPRHIRAQIQKTPSSYPAYRIHAAMTVILLRRNSAEGAGKGLLSEALSSSQMIPSQTRSISLDRRLANSTGSGSGSPSTIRA